MKSIKLITLASLLLSTSVMAESLYSYISKNTQGECQGEIISTAQLSQKLEMLDSAKCSVFEQKVYKSLKDAGVNGVDGYNGELLVLKLVQNNKIGIKAGTILMRDTGICLTKKDNGTEVVTYNSVSRTAQEGVMDKIKGGSTHLRRSIIQIKDNKLKWAGQSVTNSSRSYLRTGLSSDLFQCSSN